jgi:hypothetical protein
MDGLTNKEKIMNNQDKPVRYIWNFGKHKYLYNTFALDENDTIGIPCYDELTNGKVFVNILDRVPVFADDSDCYAFHVQLIFPNEDILINGSNILTGWFVEEVSDSMFSTILLDNEFEVFDGRFNQQAEKTQINRNASGDIGIFRDDYDCELNHFHGRNRINMEEIHLVTKEVNGKMYTFAEPIEKGSWAFGGTFLFTSNSIFPQFNTPVKLHDRNMRMEH